MLAPMYRNAMVLTHGGATKRCVNRLASLGVCVAYNTVLKKIEALSKDFDSTLLQWKANYETANGSSAASLNQDNEHNAPPGQRQSPASAEEDDDVESAAVSGNTKTSPHHESTRKRIHIASESENYEDANDDEPGRDDDDGVSATEISSYRSRNRWMPPEKKPYHCTECNLRFRYKRRFLQHQHKAHGKEIAEVDWKYPCLLCNKSFARPARLKLHSHSHMQVKPFRCHDCGASFVRKAQLQGHRKSRHREKGPGLLCTMCGKLLSTAGSLKIHLLTHSETKPHVCPQCDRSFANIYYLKHHMRMHDGTARRYPCPNCERMYRSVSALRSHQRDKHQKDKPHRCPNCGKSFLKKSRLHIHMRIHTGERPYACQACGKGFNQKGDRNRHASRCTAVAPGKQNLERPITPDLQGAGSSLLTIDLQAAGSSLLTIDLQGALTEIVH